MGLGEITQQLRAIETKYLPCGLVVLCSSFGCSTCFIFRILRGNPRKGMTMESIGMAFGAPSSLLDSEIPYPEMLEAADPESQHVSAGEPLYPKGPKYQYSGM